MKRILMCIIFMAVFVTVSLSVLAQETENDGYLLSFKDDKARKDAELYMESLGTLTGEEYSVSQVYDVENLYKSYDEDLLEDLYEMGFLEYYEPNAVGYLFDYDYNLDSVYIKQQEWAHRASKASEAWEYGVYGNDVKVAYIDSGVKIDHEDLASCIYAGYSYVDKDGNGALSSAESADYNDTLGHGTNVAGVIAAKANGKGVVGVAHRAKLIPIKITDKGSFSTAELASSVYKAVDLGADVINMSLGTKSNMSSLNIAIRYAQSQGVIVVAASGNTSSYTQGTAVYPAYNSNVISVGNLAHSGYNYYISTGSIANAGVTVCAPGSSVHTTSINYNYTYYGYYTTASGTSFAAPYVAGIAALAKSIDPDITSDEFMQILKDTARKDVLNGAEHTNEYGYGIADAGAVVRYMISQRENGGFISPVDRAESGEINVKIYNPRSTEMTYGFTAKVESTGRPLSFAYKTITLAPGGVTEIPLASLYGSFFADISCYLFDAKRFAPVYKKIES